MKLKSVIIGIAFVLGIGVIGQFLPTSFPYALDEYPEPVYPERPVARAVSPNVQSFRAQLPISAGQPGQQSNVWVYLPANTESKTDQAHPCLFYTSAGAAVFGGMSLSESDESEILPYVNLGFAVVCYETDGALNLTSNTSKQQMADSADQYVASCAGLVNARNAMNFTLARFPEIDSKQLYAIGHSSGGKQALLWAAHEPRLKGCVTFAPATELSLGERIGVAAIPAKTASLTTAIKRSMPRSHRERIKLPVLIIHTEKDKTVRSNELKRFARSVGNNVQLAEVPADDHFDLPRVGFPNAAQWLTQAAGLATSSDTAAMPAVMPVANRASGGGQANPFAN